MAKRRTLRSVCADFFSALSYLTGIGGTKVRTRRLPELKARNRDLLALKIPGTKRKVNASTNDRQRISTRTRALKVSLVA